MSRPLVLGHRGYPELTPENSLEGFRAASQAGADGVELDVRSTRDGALVVLHSPELDGVPVYALTRREVSRLAPLAPDLDQALDAIQGVALIEFKPGGSIAELNAARDLARACAASSAVRPVVGCFDPWFLRAVAETGVPTALLLGTHTLSDASALRRADLGFAQVLALVHDLVPSDVLSVAVDQGLEVWTWTVDQDQVLARVVGQVAAIITNRPGWALRQLG